MVKAALLPTMIFLAGFLPACLCGCALFDLWAGGPEFSLSGSRVAPMPFGGPGNWWYGESPLSREIYRRAAGILREGGAEICISKRLNQELLNYVEDREPPWIDYGKRLGADYVVVGQVLRWTLNSPKAVGYVPGTASLEVRVYSVNENKLVFQKTLNAEVGLDSESTDIYTDPLLARKALIMRLLKKWRGLFVAKGGFD